MGELGEIAMWRDHGAEIVIAIGMILALVITLVSGRLRSRRQMRAAEAAYEAMRRSSEAVHDSRRQ